MAVAVQLVDGDVAQAHRRAIFDLRAHHAVRQGDPLVGAALAAVQADAFAAQHLGHLDMDGGGPQHAVQDKERNAHQHTYQYRRHQAQQGRTAAVPDQQPFAGFGEGAFAPYHTQKSGEWEQRRQQVGKPQHRKPADMPEQQRAAARGTGAKQCHLGPQIDGQRNGHQRAGHHQDVAQIEAERVARMHAQRRQIDRAAAARLEGKAGHERPSCGRTNRSCPHTTSVRTSQPTAA